MVSITVTSAVLKATDFSHKLISLCRQVNLMVVLKWMLVIIRKQVSVRWKTVSPVGALTSGLVAGRWTTEEHRLFLQGLQLHNKQWKLIADLVKTRTVVQIRTHAQKYFQKLEKLNQTKQRSDSVCTVDSAVIKAFSAVSIPSRANSISSADSVHNGQTSSEGESDGEHSPKSAEGASDLKITFPMVLMTKQQSGGVAHERKKSGSFSSPRKRSRDSKPAGENLALNRSKRANNRSSSDISDVTSVELALSNDPFDDFLPFVDMNDELDHSLYHLMEKIDWHAEEQQLLASSSSLRASPFAVVAPGAPVMEAATASYGQLPTSTSYGAPVVSASAPAPGSTPYPFQQLSIVTAVEPKVVYSSVLDEFKLLINRCLSECEGNASYPPSTVICQQLPSLRALTAMSSSGIKVPCGNYSYLTPMNSAYYQYPIGGGQHEKGVSAPAACSSPQQSPNKKALGRTVLSLSETSLESLASDPQESYAEVEQAKRLASMLEEKIDDELSFLDYAH